MEPNSNNEVEDRDMWEPRTPDEQAHIAHYKGAAKSVFWWVLAFLAVAFVMWMIAWTRPAEGRGLVTEVARPYTSYDGEFIADRTSPARRPCWARSSEVTCTPTPVPPLATPSSTPTDTATPVPATPSVTPTPCEGGYWQCVATVTEFEHETARLINLHRASPPHDPWYESGIALDLRADLSTAERLHAIEMIGDPNDPNDDRCEHGDYGTRAAEQGYTGWAWGNIGACGYPSPAETVQGWIDSPGHHWIMDEPNAMTEMGVGAAKYANNYWQAWVTIGCGGGIPCMASSVGPPPPFQMSAPVVGPGR